MISEYYGKNYLLRSGVNPRNYNRGESLKKDIFVFNDKKELITGFKSIVECAKYCETDVSTIYYYRKNQKLFKGKYYFSPCDCCYF